MKKYTLNYRGCMGQYGVKTFEATCDTDARFAARMFAREIWRQHGCAPALFDFYGNYIEL
jgi:hypothetical protein